jgi:transcriptional regulator with XRE-family HTH domain
MSQIGPRLRRLREERGLSQEAVARRADISHGTYVRTELGNTTPSIATAQKIADALGVSLTDLTGDPSRDENGDEEPAAQPA